VAYQGAVHGVRYLFPYVDYRVMDFALSIPRSQHIRYNRNRYIFREAFRDLLPDGLYNKTYKYQASTHHLSADTPSREIHLQQVERILGKLDPELWSSYLNFEELRKLLYSYNGELGGIGSLDSLLDYLYRCTLIQDVQKNAKRWREFDEQDKTV
jgi:asparagine synthase (glutamine-hydrolysing)